MWNTGERELFEDYTTLIEQYGAKSNKVLDFEQRHATDYKAREMFQIVHELHASGGKALRQRWIRPLFPGATVGFILGLVILPVVYFQYVMNAEREFTGGSVRLAQDARFSVRQAPQVSDRHSLPPPPSDNSSPRVAAAETASRDPESVSPTVESAADSASLGAPPSESSSPGPRRKLTQGKVIAVQPINLVTVEGKDGKRQTILVGTETPLLDAQGQVHILLTEELRKLRGSSITLKTDWRPTSYAAEMLLGGPAQVPAAKAEPAEDKPQ